MNDCRLLKKTHTHDCLDSTAPLGASFLLCLATLLAMLLFASACLVVSLCHCFLAFALWLLLPAHNAPLVRIAWLNLGGKLQMYYY